MKRTKLEGEGFNLAVAFRDHEAEILRFCGDLRIPLTNNQGERDLWMRDARAGRRPQDEPTSLAAGVEFAQYVGFRFDGQRLCACLAEAQLTRTRDGHGVERAHGARFG